MAVKMDAFLLQYYRQLIFNDMPSAVRAQFDTYSRGDDFRGNMGTWKKDLISGNMPDPDLGGGAFELNTDEWEKLFKAFQNAFRSMNAARDSFVDNKKANEFLDECFGVGKLFSMATANGALKSDITSVQSVLVAQKDILSKWLQKNGNFFESEDEYDKFVSALTNTPPDEPKYNTDEKFQKKLKDIADWLSYGLSEGAFDNYTTGVKAALSGVTSRLQNIKQGFVDTAISPARLAIFKNSYEPMLRRLYKDGKVREVFEQHDGGKITGQLKKAQEKTDYANKESKDYIPPKRDDELTLGQHISDWVGKTYEDNLEKYVKLKGDRLFFSPSAKFIVKAIDGAKIKPTDGLEKVLAESKKISDNLQYKSPKAAESFKYFVEIMNELKDTMPRAFAGALRNGRQMRALVEAMVLSAVEKGKVEEAKVAMEVLSVIKYGYTTSKIMDNLKKEKLTIFSDTSLSWNKNDGMKFVTAALDKSIKVAMLGVGYGITIGGNAINRIGTKFDGKSKRIDPYRTAQDNENNADKQSIESEYIVNRQRLRSEESTLNNMGQGPNAIHDRNINAYRNRLGRDSARLQTHKDDKDKWQGQVDEINEQIRLKNDEIRRLTDWINRNANNPQLAQAQQALQQASFDLNMLQNQDLASATQNFQDAERNFNNLRPSLTRRGNRIAQFDNAKANVQVLTEHTNTIRKTLDEWNDAHKDQYRELMAHWDFLNTGENVRSWSIGSKSAKQGKLDTKVDLIDPVTGRPRLDANGIPVQDFKRNVMLGNYYDNYRAA